MYLNVKDLKDDNKINEFLDLVNKNKVNPYYLHSSEVVNEITSKKEFLTPLSILGINEKENLIKTMEIAQKVADSCKHTVTIVFHNDTEELCQSEKLMSAMKVINNLLLKFLNVNINLENVIGDYPDDFGYREEALKYIKLYKTIYPDTSNRIHITFDTCHAIASLRRINNDAGMSHIVLEPMLLDMFSAQAKYITEIHLADCLGFGKNDKNNHARPFDFNDTDSIERLKMILRIIEKTNWSGDMTLEVNEDFYPSSNNFLKEYIALTAMLEKNPALERRLLHKEKQTNFLS